MNANVVLSGECIIICNCRIIFIFLLLPLSALHLQEETALIYFVSFVSSANCQVQFIDVTSKSCNRRAQQGDMLAFAALQSLDLIKTQTASHSYSDAQI